MTALDADLAKIACLHDGLITRTHAAARHVSPNVLRAAVRDGSLHRMRPGLFVTRSRWLEAQPHERYALTARGLLLTHPDWIASHHAALALHGLPLHDVDLRLVDFAAPVRASKVRPGLHIHVATAEQIEHAGTTSPRAVPVADACVLTAAASGFRAGVVAMDAALARSLTTPRELEAALLLPGARYGVARSRAAIAATDSRCESPGETLTRLVLRDAGMVVRSQVTITDGDGFIGRVDLLVGERVVVEFDGAVKYAGLDGARELMKEKQREERLRDAGYRVVRVTWADLSHPDRLVRRVLGQLAA
jgi:very-short-patch-repair endonuclease